MLKKINAADFILDDLYGIDFSGKTLWIAFREWYLQNEKDTIEKVIDYVLNVLRTSDTSAT